MIEFVTYAQNFEDLMLWRALHSVQDGFYIDVGAADPDEDSVTRAFHDRGWHGINIEPSPQHFAAISAARPRDINLHCLAGDGPGEMQFYNFPDTGLSTVKKDLAEKHTADGRPVEVIRRKMRTLAAICRESAPPDIHFLKIDVEGAEADVLRGADFTTYRPWIVLVEATVPSSPAENWQAWDPLLTKAGYTFVWFDGLNRFYLAQERADHLRHAFRTPPNVFDYWVRPRAQQQMAMNGPQAKPQAPIDRLQQEPTKTPANQEAEAAHKAAAALRAALATAHQDLSIAQAEMDRLAEAQQAQERAEAMVAALLASTSWKVTAPLRVVSRGLQVFKGDPARQQRLQRVAELGQGPAGRKGAVRIAAYGFGRLLARTSAGRAAAHLVRVALPGPYQWLYTRYSVYRRAAASAAAMQGALPSTFDPPPSCHTAAGNPDRYDLSAEEQIMLLRLRARNLAA